MNDKFTNPQAKKKYWNVILLELQQKYPDMGHRTHQQVSKRFQNMSSRYSHEKAKMNSGASPSTWEYYQEFHKVLHTRADQSLENAFNSNGNSYLFIKLLYN
jgi:hypothetical protein